MVTRNLRSFLAKLQSKQALFQVETILSAPEIVLNPSAGEIFKITMQTVRDSVERWVTLNYLVYRLDDYRIPISVR
jgi:dynein heavy chain